MPKTAPSHHKPIQNMKTQVTGSFAKNCVLFSDGKSPGMVNPCWQDTQGRGLKLPREKRKGRNFVHSNAVWWGALTPISVLYI